MKIKLTFCYLFISFQLFSQGVSNLWLMGYDNYWGQPWGGMNLNFITGSLNITYQERPFNFNCTNGVICDKRGKLLFCSNGIAIVNGDFDTLKNGSGINPAYFTTLKRNDGLTIPQANLILPVPADTSKYYLFHETCDDYNYSYCSFYLYYSIIDMKLDNGKGEVIEKNKILLDDFLVGGRLTACKHANGRDWWLIAHQCHSDKYFKYLVTPTGIAGPFEQNIGAWRDTNFGQAVFSPDGTKFVYYEPTSDLDIMNFDRCTGDLSNNIHVAVKDSDDAYPGGAAFSSNSNVLYITTGTEVLQYDITANDIPASRTTVAVYDSFIDPFPTIFYMAQLAPDGKIYINCGNGTQSLHVINNPDVIGTGCDVCQHCIHLPAFNAFTIPNHPNYFLGAETGSVCDSLTSLTPTLSKEEGVLNIYPNPSVTEDVTFSYSVSPEQGVLAVYNIEGKEVAKYCIPQWSSVQHLKLPKMAGGVYMARLTQGNKVSNTKFLKE